MIALPSGDHWAPLLAALVLGMAGPCAILALVLAYSRRKLARVRRKEAVLELDDLR